MRQSGKGLEAGRVNHLKHLLILFVALVGLMVVIWCFTETIVVRKVLLGLAMPVVRSMADLPDPSHLKSKEQCVGLCVLALEKPNDSQSMNNDMKTSHEVIDVTILIMVMDHRRNVAEHFGRQVHGGKDRTNNVQLTSRSVSLGRKYHWD